ncbi:secretory calcium-binding phosphoprotein 5 [Aplochiton taeniatus]
MKMKVALLCLCLASFASAAPSFFHYLPHYGFPRQAGAPTQVNDMYPMNQPLPHPGINSPVSMEIVFAPGFPSMTAGGPNSSPQSNPTQAFIKYSLPKAPGRKSVEIYYPYDFAQQKMMPSIPQMPHLPQMPSYEARPPQSQDPLQGVQQDQPMQTGQEKGNKERYPLDFPQQYLQGVTGARDAACLKANGET